MVSPSLGRTIAAARLMPICGAARPRPPDFLERVAVAPALSGRERVAADAYLRLAVLISPLADPAEPVEDDGEWATWFARWSLPMTDVTPTHLHRYLDTIRVEALDGRRRTIGRLTVERYRVAIKAVFRAAAAQRVIEWNLWEGADYSLPEDEG